MTKARAVNTNPTPSLRLLTLGGLTLVRTDGSAPHKLLGAGKPAAMLAYLTTLPGRQAGREHLKDLLWSDLSPTSADHAFRQATWLLRQRIGQDALLTGNGTLHLATSLRTDRDDFLAAVESGDLEEAVRLYGGDYLDGVALPGGLEHEHWADAERYRLRLIFLRTAEVMVRGRLETAGFREAAPLARRVRDTDRSSERGWRLLIETLVSSGDLVSAEVEADGLDRMLAADERDAEPATAALLARVRHRDPTEAPSDEIPLVAELVGREREFATIVDHWKRTQTGLGAHLHVIAPAGLGKSRLLHDVHRRLRIGGARTVMLRANPGDRSVPYGFAGDLAEALGALPGASGVSPGLAAHLVALHPQLSETFDVAAAPDNGPDIARHRTLAIAELMCAVAEDRPFALLIDDVHWIDTVSHQLIISILERCRQTPALIVTTARPTTRGRLSASRTQIVRLSPLEVGEIADLIASIAVTPASSWADRLPTALHAATGGSPLLILEALQLAGEHGWLSYDDGIWRCDNPDALFEELARGGPMARRILALESDRQWTLLVLAVAGTPLDDRALTRVSPDAATPECLSDLERRGLLAREPAGWTVAHDELAQTAMDAASSDLLRAAHTSVGDLRASSSTAGALTQAADHFIQAEQEGRLTEVLRRRLTLARRDRETISLRKIAEALLGPHAAEERIQRMIRSLPAHVAWRYSRVRLSIAGAVVIALLLAGMLAWQPDPPPADAVLTVTRAAPDGTIEAYDLAFHAESWDVSTPLADLAESPLQPYARDNGRDVLPSPERTRWIVERATNDSGGIDLFLPTHDGEVRLTHTPGDDKLPLWSPDGAMVVFHTARWNANSWYDLATMDMETQEIRRLTSTNAQDHLGSWSPDGSRIAFYRRWIEEPHPEQVCHIARDGTDERCYDPIGGTWLGVVGWYDPVTIITVLDSDGRQLAYFNLERRTLTRTPIIMHDRGAVSPDGRWLLCHCVEAGDDRLRWLIVPTDRPRDSRHLMSGDTVLYNVRWRRGSLPPRYVDSLTVRAPTTEVPLETSHRFVAEGFGPDGARVPMGPVRWTVDDSQIATIDADGTIHPLREGVVRVRASLGGWREASATVRIVAPTYQITLREAWTPDWETRWRSFGDPRPERNEGPDGIHGIMNGGDGSFHSGAYRHLAFDASQGLGVDAALSTPLTEVQWQTQYVGLHAAADTSWYPVWDHSTRGIPMTSDDASCQFLFPANTGLHASNQYRVSVIRIDQQTFTDSTLKTGAWYHVRIQLFPDGRCGVAVNGMARWISSGRAPTTVPYRLGVAGNSKGTKMLVGPLEVWTGVRPGIDWSVAQPNR